MFKKQFLLGPVLLIEGNLEVKFPTKWTDGKAEVRRVSEKKRREKIREEERGKKEDAGAPKARKVAIHCVVPVEPAGEQMARLCWPKTIRPPG